MQRHDSRTVAVSTRRSFLSGIPAAAAAVTIPVAAVAQISETMSAKERADFHYREFVKAMSELTEGFDGWNLYASERKGFHHLKAVSHRSFQSVTFGLDTRRANPIVFERHTPLKI